MRKTIILSNLFASVAFAAADTAAGATESTDTAEVTENPNAAFTVLADKDQLATLNDAMDSRELFGTLAEAIAKAESVGNATEGFFGLPIAIKGQNVETGEIDESIYEGSGAILGYVGARVEIEGGKTVTGVKSIVIFPAPTLEAFMEADGGSDYLRKILEKELGLVFYRKIRDASTLNELRSGVEQGPATVAEYLLENSRSGSGLNTKAFDSLWSAFRAGLKKQHPALSALLPGKAEVIKAIRSKSYALGMEAYAPLEKKGVFAWLASVIIESAANNIDGKTKEAAPIDATAIEGWLAGRDSLEIAVPKTASADFSILDDMFPAAAK